MGYENKRLYCAPPNPNLILWYREKLVNVCSEIIFSQVIVWWAIVILFGFCIFNVSTIVERYEKFETLISKDNELPTKTRFPGITICGAAIFTPEKLAQLYPNSSLSKAYSWFKSHYHGVNVDLIPSNLTEVNYELFLKYESRALQEMPSVRILNKHSVSLEELVLHCIYRPITLRNFVPKAGPPDDTSFPYSQRYNCTGIKHALPIIYDGRKCFTFFSLLHNWQHGWLKHKRSNYNWKTTRHNRSQSSVEQDSHQHHHHHHPYDDDDSDSFGSDMDFDMNPHIELVVNMNESIWSFIGLPRTTLTVHPSNSLPSRSKFQSMTLARRAFYEVSFTRKTTTMLPSPYLTRCINYTNDARFAHYRTSDECRNVCLQKYIDRIDACLSYKVPLTPGMLLNELKDRYICSHVQQNFTSYLEATRECGGARHCPNECVKALYETTGHTDTNRNDECRWFLRKTVQNHYLSPLNNSTLKWKRILPLTKQCNTKIIIKMSATPFQTIHHQAAYTREEFLGTMGGHLGIWLGLSVYTFVEFAVHLTYHLLRHMFWLACGSGSRLIRPS